MSESQTVAMFYTGVHVCCVRVFEMFVNADEPFTELQRMCLILFPQFCEIMFIMLINKQ